MYKDCFKLMDINKDGQLDKNDLRGAFDNVGVLMSESELDGLLGEISGPCTYDNMVKMFQGSRPAGRQAQTRSRGAAADVQGLLQAYGHQQGWRP